MALVTQALAGAPTWPANSGQSTRTRAQLRLKNSDGRGSRGEKNRRARVAGGERWRARVAGGRGSARPSPRLRVGSQGGMPTRTLPGTKPPEASLENLNWVATPPGRLVRSCSFPFLPTAPTDLLISLYTYWRRASIKAGRPVGWAIDRLCWWLSGFLRAPAPSGVQGVSAVRTMRSCSRMWATE